MSERSGRPRSNLPLVLVTGIAALFVVRFVLFPTDATAPHLEPAPDAPPGFAVQILRPALALPLGGLLPPHLFGLDDRIGFDSEDAGATVGSPAEGRWDFLTDEGSLRLTFDDDGLVSAETEVVFEMLFEERRRRLRARPAEPFEGEISVTTFAEAATLSGHFEFDLAPCEDAASGEPLGWPSAPLRLRGSFVGVPAESASDG